jgi:hypothetical protein
VRVRDDESDTGESAVVECGEELAPERLVLGVADIEPEELAMPVRSESGGDYYRFGHDVTVLSDMHPGGVRPDVHERLMIEPVLRTWRSASIWVQILGTMLYVILSPTSVIEPARSQQIC